MTLWNHTMRDILNKLDTILLETQLNPKDPVGDYKAKKKALLDLQMDPVIGNDPELSKAVMQRKADLEKEASAKGVGEKHMSPSGKMTNMNPKDDDYEINYGKGAAQ